MDSGINSVEPDDGINSVEVESDTQGSILSLVIPNPFDETTFEVRTGEVPK
jgi:hypothetical protein